MSLDPNTINAERAAADIDAAHAVIGYRWAQLLAWLGNSSNVPEIHAQRDSWEAYDKAYQARHSLWGTVAPYVVGQGAPYVVGAGAYEKQNTDDGIRGQASDLAVAESNAARHGYVVPRLAIDGSNNVTRADAGQATGAQSPGPTSPAVAGHSTVTTVAQPPTTPSNETLHPIATAIDEAAPKPPPAPENVAPKAAALGAVALGTIAGVLAVKGDAAKAGVAIAGTLGAALLGFFLFSPSAPKLPTDPKNAGIPATERRHAHTCHHCGNVWWHDPEPCLNGNTPAACTIAHVCAKCGHIESRVDTSICETEGNDRG